MNRDEQIESGVYYHVYNRGNDRDRIFGDESDYFAFIEKMKSLAVKYSVEVPVYALMPNHYHLIARQVPSVEGHLLPSENRVEGDLQPGLSRMMGALATSAAKRYNLKYAHIGHLFQGPFRYKQIPDDALWTVACYIHLNPVRAGLASKPKEWMFSNYAECAKQKEIFNNDMPEQKITFNTKATFYHDFVEEVLNHEQAEKEYRKRMQKQLEGFLE
jgi:REP element-mobilizing transposase RayT